MKQIISLLLSVLFVQSLSAGFKNVPTYSFETVSQNLAAANTELARCQSDLASKQLQLTAKGARVLDVRDCSLSVSEGDQIQSTYTVTGSILFL